MSEETLFEAEETIIRRAEEMLAQGTKENHRLRHEFEHLLGSYKKVYKQLRRLIKINDKQAKKLNEANLLLTGLSTIDGLTGVHNRRYFDEGFETEWKRAWRARAPLSLLLIDIDFFKKVNDTHGHQAGDVCLKLIAGTLKSSFRRCSDLVARYGGEEFCVLLPGTAGADASNLAEVLRRKVEDLIIPHEGLEIKLTISIGLSSQLPQFPEDREKMLAMADEALYRAKQTGRNRVCQANAEYEK